MCGPNLTLDRPILRIGSACTTELFACVRGIHRSWLRATPVHSAGFRYMTGGCIQNSVQFFIRWHHNGCEHNLPMRQMSSGLLRQWQRRLLRYISSLASLGLVRLVRLRLPRELRCSLVHPLVPQHMAMAAVKLLETRGTQVFVSGLCPTLPTPVSLMP